MAIAINYRVAPVLFVAVAIEFAVFFCLLRRGLPFFALVQQKIDRINTVIRENLAGIRLIKILSVLPGKGRVLIPLIRNL